MRSKRDRLITFIVGVVALLTFVITSFVALVWANGLSFDAAKKNFRQTAMIAIEARLTNVAISVNGEKVAQASPYQIRSLEAGRYELLLSKPGFQDFRQVFQLSAGEVGIVPETVRLLAVNPKTEILSDATYVPVSLIEVGLSVNDGELVDQGVLVTRFSSDPPVVRRFNDGYIYQTGSELRYFYAASNSDTLIWTLESSEAAKLTVNQADWEIVVFGSEAKRIFLTVPNAEPASSS